MSSVLLPKWKQEPLSPINTNLDEVTWLSSSEDTLYQTTTLLEEECIKFEQNELDLVLPGETKAEVASLVLEHLENLIDLDELIKEENFLLDEKILPILDEVDPSRAIECIKLEQQHQRQAQETQFLLKEFETVYDGIAEFAHDTLTPPQSPPSDQQKILTTLEPLLQPSFAGLKQQPPYSVPEKHLLGGYRVASPAMHIPLEYPSTPQPDIAHELAVVDELVRTRVEDMQWASSGPSSPNSSSSSSCSSSTFGDCSSSEDPEWTPEPLDGFQSFAEALPAAKSAKKRSKPYSRANNVDKKSRKKEQNKNAATRYRMKKKAEVEVILSEEKQLAMKNDDLEGKITDMQREIKYLKGLMRDLFKAKGLIN